MCPLMTPTCSVTLLVTLLVTFFLHCSHVVMHIYDKIYLLIITWFEIYQCCNPVLDTNSITFMIFRSTHAIVSDLLKHFSQLVFCIGILSSIKIFTFILRLMLFFCNCTVDFQ